MQKTPWSDEMRNEIKRFGTILLTIREQLEGARAAGLSCLSLDVSESDSLLDEFERGLRQLDELNRQWEAKQPELLALQKEGERLGAESQVLNIQSQADYEQAQKLLTAIQKNKDHALALFEPFLTGSEQNYRRVVRLEDQILSTLKIDQEQSA